MFIFEAVVFACLSAAVMSVAQAWALAASPRRWARYVAGGAAGTVTIALALLFLIGFRLEIPDAHQNVVWTAFVLAAATTAAAFGLVGSRYSPEGVSVAPESAFALVPGNLGIVAVLGIVDYLVLALVFLGNIH